MGDFWANAVVVAVVAIAVYFWWRGRQKTKSEAWEGILENKDEKSTTDSEGDDITWYMFYVKLNDGSIKEIEVKEKIFGQFEVGDKIYKKVGELNPSKTP